MHQLTGLLGVAAILLIGFALSKHRRHINYRTLATGVVLQIALAYLFLSWTPLVVVFTACAALITKIISFADDGTRFIFGNASDASGAWGFIFAVRVLPIIIFFAAFMAVLYHLGAMQRVISVLARALRTALGITGIEAMSASANIFVGQTEAPLTIKPFIAQMTSSQIMCVMVCGFSTIAGSVMAAYIVIIGGDDTDARIALAKHFMTASVISTVAGIVMAKLLWPETETPADESAEAMRAMPRTTIHVMDAAAEGATDGLKLALNVAAMLVAFVSLLALLNWPLSALSEVNSEWFPMQSWRAEWGVPVLSFQNILGMILAPLAWLMGAGVDAHKVGSLMGTQVIATEFVAYLDLAAAIRDHTISPRGAVIATYALCGFANLPSIAIQIGGLSALAPERRGDFARIGMRAMIAGALACWMAAAIAGLFVSV